MLQQRRLRPILLLLLALVSITLLAVSISSLSLEWGNSIRIEQGRSSPSEFFEGMQTEELTVLFRIFFILLAVTMLPIAVVQFIRSSEIRKRILFRAFILALNSYFLLLLLQRVSGRNLLPSANPPGASSSELPPILTIDTGLPPPQWLIFGVSLVLAGLIVGGIWFIRRRRDASDLSLALASETRQALDRLRAGADREDTILRCYSEMARLLDRRRGVKRKATMTAREFESHLTREGVPAAPLQRLTRLFELVRYGHKNLGAGEKSEAESCLTEINQALGGL